MNKQIASLTRRNFLASSASLAAGLTIGTVLPTRSLHARTNAPGSTEINAWVHIDSDGQITIIAPNAEMGQGVFTSMPALVAEELEVSLEDILIKHAHVDARFVNTALGVQGTGASTSIRYGFDPLRMAGATAREMLRQAAAAAWDCDIAECQASDGWIQNTEDGRTLSYGELAVAASELPAPKDVALKEPADWRILGTAFARSDIPAKTKGTAEFGIDVKVDDMRYGAVTICPHFGGTLKNVDTSAAETVPGVLSVIPLEDAVIVVADSYWVAKNALDALEPEWEVSNLENSSSSEVRNALLEAVAQGGSVAADRGEVSSALGNASQVIEATYDVPYLAHATMEPMNATAHVRDDGVDIWAPTQGPWLVQFVASNVLQVDPESIDVHTTFLGGGFGRRYEVDFIVYAVLASKVSSVPVKLIYSREDDVAHDFYRPAAAGRIVGGLDSDGNLTAMQVNLACQSVMSRVFPDYVRNGIDPISVEGASDIPFEIPDFRVEYAIVESPIPAGFWRSVGHSQNAFFVQSFMDEVAAENGTDPVETQISLLPDTRHQHVARRAAELIGWDTQPIEGRSRGFALHESFGSIVAEAFEISVTPEKEVTIHKIACVVDCGTVINPDTVRAQMEGGIVYGITAAFYGRIDIEDGVVRQSNFHDYEMMTMAQMPEIVVEIVESSNVPGGVGEPSTPPVAPALANAIFRATGERVRSLPLSNNGYKLP